MAATYIDNDGVERPERRRRPRDHENERIGRLFNGFDNLMLTAKENGDGYGFGYAQAMRKEFAGLLKELVP